MHRLSIFQAAQPRQRRSIRELQQQYDQGNRKPLSDLLRAFRGIQELDPTDENSFFVIAGLHGEPFRGAGWGNPQWWGGYCNHGNVLFPTWHRAYCLRIENALRSIAGCENVTLPYWDETSIESAEEGLPAILTQRRVELDDGTTIDNPLYAYTFQKAVTDNLSFPPISSSDGANVETINVNYSKKQGRPTVRYPFSSLEYAPETAEWNAKMEALGDEKTTEMLNTNIKAWLSNGDPAAQSITGQGILHKFSACLNAPNYTVFSNTTSAVQWFSDTNEHIVPLEDPHNDMHLAVGGFSVKGQGDFDPTVASDANGDMGENDTAAFDPVFFLHHCWIDRMFWKWQQIHDATNALSIIDGYPGTNSVDNQGPTPGVAGGSWLSLNSPLDPFKINNRPMTSKDVINIERQLNYTYVDPPQYGDVPKVPQLTNPAGHLQISGINRGDIAGSFVLATYKNDKATGKRALLHLHSVLSRWHVSGCSNCMTHVNLKVIVPLHNVSDADLDDEDAFSVELVTRSVGWKKQPINGLIPKRHLQVVKKQVKAMA